VSHRHSWSPPKRPPAHLVLGPSGSGKTEWAFDRFLQAPDRSLLIVSSPDQVKTRKGQLAARLGCDPGAIPNAVQSLRDFAQTIGRQSQRGELRPITRPLQRLIVGEILPSAIRSGDYFGRMLDGPGFAPALVERIREWKLADIAPDDLEGSAEAVAAALGDPSYVRKAAEIARIYRTYQDFLDRNGLLDEEDALWRNIVDVADGRKTPSNHARQLIVDGFYRFNRAQRLLLAAVATARPGGRQGGATLAVTLPYDPGRPLLFAASERTLQTLRAEFHTTEESCSGESPHRAASLARLERRLFSFAPVPDQPSATDPAMSCAEPADAPVLLMDAPNPYAEVEMVAREICTLHAAAGYAWSDFTIILRSAGDYAAILAAVFERYGIPLCGSSPEPLSGNPLLETALRLLVVYRDGWQREDVVAFLKSSYTPCGKVQAELLGRRARRERIREGRERWLALTAQDEGPVGAAIRLMAAQEDELLGRIARTGDCVTALSRIVAAFGMTEAAQTGDPGIARRDRAAWSEAVRVLQYAVQVEEFAVRPPLDLAGFHRLAETAWKTASISPGTDPDAVRVAEPYDSRERPIRVAVVMGLTERVFPRRVSEDPFFRDDERAALRSAAGLDLDPQLARVDDERFFFYLAVTAPSERLILSFPRSAREADTLPSFYLDEVRAVLASDPGSLETRTRTLADVAPTAAESVSSGDRILAACALVNVRGAADPGSPFAADPEPKGHAGLPTHLPSDPHAELPTLLPSDPHASSEAADLAAVLESRLLPRLPALRSPDLLSAFGRQRSIFSVSELETYRRCPFQYLLRHVLRLHPDEEGAGPRVQGSLLHAVLREYFREARDSAAPAGDVDALKKGLRSALERVMAPDAIDDRPHRVEMSKRLLQDSLDGFADREHTFRRLFGLTPSHFELGFGVGHPGANWRDDEEQTADVTPGEPHDPASTSRPLRIESADGSQSISVCGTIDRVDLDESGSRAMVLDYKMTRSVEYSAMQRGDSLQMPLYLMAAERLFGWAAGAACYDAMKEAGRRRVFRSEHFNTRCFGPAAPRESGTMVKPLSRDEYASLIRTAESTVLAAASAIRSGRVDATPGDHCGWCPYSDVCRTTLAGGHDGE
jgi:ATP-dependent helicase/nuclease subunit B